MRVRLALFISSYSPLFVILAIRFAGAPLRLAMAGLAAVGVLLLVSLLFFGAKGEPQPYVVQSVKDRGSEVAGYIATYLLPLIVLNQPTAEDLIGYGVFIAISAIIYVQSGLLHINPLVYLIGRKISTVQTQDGRELYIIHRQDVQAGQTIWASSVLEPLLVVRLPSIR